MRLIDADTLIAEYDRVHVGEPGGARKLMENAPTIDAVPVIRCKYCIHKPKGTGVNHDLEFPDYVCPCQCAEDDWYSWKPDDTWFCADGERGDE